MKTTKTMTWKELNELRIENERKEKKLISLMNENEKKEYRYLCKLKKCYEDDKYNRTLSIERYSKIDKNKIYPISKKNMEDDIRELEATNRRLKNYKKMEAEFLKKMKERRKVEKLEKAEKAKKEKIKKEKIRKEEQEVEVKVTKVRVKKEAGVKEKKKEEERTTKLQGAFKQIIDNFYYSDTYTNGAIITYGSRWYRYDHKKECHVYKFYIEDGTPLKKSWERGDISEISVIVFLTLGFSSKIDLNWLEGNEKLRMQDELKVIEEAYTKNKQEVYDLACILYDRHYEQGWGCFYATCEKNFCAREYRKALKILKPTEVLKTSEESNNLTTKIAVEQLEAVANG